MNIDTLDDLQISTNTLPDYVRSAGYAMEPRESLKWLIDGIVGESSVNLWVGKYGSKKTWALLSAGVNLALGKDWLDHPTIQCPVLFIDEDMGESYLNERVNLSLRGELADENTNFKYCSMHGFDLRKPESINELQTLILAGGFGLVMIDALCNVMIGGDENSVKDTQIIFQNLRRLSDCTGASFVIAHHTNKAGDYRGSTAIPGGVDSMLLIKSDEGSEYINFESGKHRRGVPVKFAAKAVWVNDQFYLESTATLENGKHRNKAQNFVIRYLTENGASPLPAIKDAADSCSPDAARQAVYNLVDAGIIFRTNPQEGGQGAVAIYALKEV